MGNSYSGRLQFSSIRSKASALFSTLAAILSVFVLLPDSALGDIHATNCLPSPTGRSPKSWTCEWQGAWTRAKQEYDANPTQPSSSGAFWYSRIKANAENTGTPSERYMDIGRWCMLMYQITGDPTWGRKAWTAFRPILSADLSGDFMRELSGDSIVMYDWIQPVLTPTERQEFINWLNLVADTLLRGNATTPHGFTVGDSDRAASGYMFLLMLDIITAPENPRAGTFLTDTLIEPYNGPVPVGGLTATGPNYSTLRNGIHRYLETLANGGEWIESTEYNIGTTQFLLVPYVTAKRFFGHDHFPDLRDYIRSLALNVIHQISPDLRAAFQWGDNQTTGLDMFARSQQLFSLAGALQDDSQLGPIIQGFANEFVNADITGRQFVLFNPYAPANPAWRDALPSLSQMNSGQGVNYFRTGWGSNQSYFASHFPPVPEVDHYVNYGSDFALYRNGEWVIRRPIGYMMDSVTLNGMQYAGMGRMFEASGVVAQENDVNNRFSYIAGISAGQFITGEAGDPPPPFLHEWTRSLLYLPGPNTGVDTVIVFDRSNAKNPATTPISCAGVPTPPCVIMNFWWFRDRISGPLSTAPAMKQWLIQPSSEPITSADSIRWNTDGGQTVNVRTFDGASTRKIVQDQRTMTIPGYPGSPNEFRWLVRIVPNVEQQWDTFLNVIQAYSGTPQISSNELNSSAGERARGVIIHRPNEPDSVALFGAVQGPDLPAGGAGPNNRFYFDPTLKDRVSQYRKFKQGFRVNFQNTEQNVVLYLADLDTSRNWQLSIDGVAVSLQVKASGLGLAQTQVSPGTHELVLADNGILPPTPNPTASPTRPLPTATATSVPTFTPTLRPTVVPSATPTPANTSTTGPTATPTRTATRTATVLPSVTPPSPATAVPTPRQTSTAAPLPTATSTKVAPISTPKPGATRPLPTQPPSAATAVPAQPTSSVTPPSQPIVPKPSHLSSKTSVRMGGLTRSGEFLIYLDSAVKTHTSRSLKRKTGYNYSVKAEKSAVELRLPAPTKRTFDPVFDVSMVRQVIRLKKPGRYVFHVTIKGPANTSIERVIIRTPEF